MSVHNCFRDTWFHTTWIARMISCFFLNPLHKIFDYLPKVYYEMVDSVIKEIQIVEWFWIIHFHLLWNFSVLHCKSNAMCRFKFGSFLSMLELPKWLLNFLAIVDCKFSEWNRLDFIVSFEGLGTENLCLGELGGVI